MMRHIISDIIDSEILCIPSSSLHRQKIPKPPPTFVSQCFIHCNTYYLHIIEEWLDDNTIGEYYSANRVASEGNKGTFYSSDIYFEFREDAVLFLVAHK